MSEITIKAPHPGSSLEELVETWDSLMYIDKHFDEALLGEVLHAMAPDAPDIDFKPSPYPENSERHSIFLAVQYAAMIGDFAGAHELAKQLGSRSRGKH
jgi:hypothetical protein